MDTINFNDDKKEKISKVLASLLSHTERGFRKLETINTSEIALLSKLSQKNFYIAKLEYLNIANQLKKLQTLELIKNCKFEECIERIGIKRFIKELCKGITSTVGKTADLKITFTSDVSKDVNVLCDCSVLQFIVLNIMALIASHTDKEKKVINLHITDEDDKISINMWNKFSFRLDSKTIDITKALEMYSDEYDFEQIINISEALAKVISGNVSYFIEDNILKIAVSLPKYMGHLEQEVNEMAEYYIDTLGIFMAFSTVLIESIKDKDAETLDLVSLSET